MKKRTIDLLEVYKIRYSFISELENVIVEVFETLIECFETGGKLLVCGNGGSAADADHIVGELLKGFIKQRHFTNEQKSKFTCFGEQGVELANKLQGSLPAINLAAHSSLITAVMNDIGADTIYAQQMVGYGKKGDVLIGISTSGNSKSVVNAGMVAQIQGVKTIALTGSFGGQISKFFDISIKVPSDVTCDIQDMHSIVYHVICAMVEAEIWEA